MFPLHLYDIYILTGLPIHKIREETHPSPGGQMTLGILAARHYGGVPNAINDGLLHIRHIIYVMMRVIATLVVYVLGSMATHWITSG